MKLSKRKIPKLSSVVREAIASEIHWIYDQWSPIFFADVAVL